MLSDERITEIAVKAANESSGASEPAMFIMDAIRTALSEAIRPEEQDMTELFYVIVRWTKNQATDGELDPMLDKWAPILEKRLPQNSTDLADVYERRDAAERGEAEGRDDD